MNTIRNKLKTLFDFDKNLIWILLILLGVFISMSSVFYFGIPSGNDAHQHFQFAQVYYDSILAGQLIPNWSAFENYGFGGIGTRFYPPLGYLALAFAKILTGNWFDAVGITFFLIMLIGCLGVYLLTKEFFSPQIAGFAGFLYALSPFHLAQIYQFFVYGEFVASAVIPFCFLYATRICNNKKFSDTVFFGISLGLLFLSHIPSALIVSISLAVYILLIFDYNNFLESAIRFLLAIFLGLSASSFHWIRVVTEMQWLNHAGETFSTGLYDFRLYFFPYSLSFTGNFWATYTWLLFISTAIALVSLTFPIIYLTVTKFATKSRKILRGALITGLFALFMATPFSEIVWTTLPLLQKVQFPWRWFSIVTLFGVIGSAAVLVLLSKKFYTKRLFLYSVIIIFCCLMSINYVQIIIPSAQMSREGFEEKLSNLLNEESFECWWAIWSKKQAFERTERVIAPSRKVKIIKWERENRFFELKEGETTDLRVATFYYPYWKAKVNQQETQIKPDNDGTILISIPTENSEISLSFIEPYFVKIAKAVSLLSWIFFILCGIAFLYKNLKSVNKSTIAAI